MKNDNDIKNLLIVDGDNYSRQIMEEFAKKVPHQFSASPGRRFFGRGLDFLKELM